MILVRQKKAPVSVPAAAIAARSAAVSSSCPFPLAPKSRTFNAPLSAGYGAAFAAPQSGTDASDIASAVRMNAIHATGLRRMLDLGGVGSGLAQRSGSCGQQVLVMIDIGIDHSLDRMRLGERVG